MRSKKAALQELLSMIGPVVAVGMVLVIGLLILASVKSNITTLNSGSWCATNYSYNSSDQLCHNQTGSVGPLTQNPSFDTSFNATTTTQTALATIPGWLPIIIVAIVGALLLGLVSYYNRR